MKWYLLVIKPAAAYWRRMTGTFFIAAPYPLVKPAPYSRSYPGFPTIFKIVLVGLLVINAGNLQAQQPAVAEDTAYIKVVNGLNGAETFSAYIKRLNPDITKVQDFHRLRPIPLPEMQSLLNAAEFGQNQGYQ